MRQILAWFAASLSVAGLLMPAGRAEQPKPLEFLSTQLRPIAEAQKIRNLVLKGFPRDVDYITTQPQQFSKRVEAEEQGDTHTIDVVGALHNELLSLVRQGALMPVDDLAGRLRGRGIPDQLLTLGKLGTTHQLYIPWMQASYVMVANKLALPYLPEGADIDALSYDQLEVWVHTVAQKTGKRVLGFPAGHQGLMHRFFEGFLYPSYTGGVVVPFRSQAAEAMWTKFASLWECVNPNSTTYNFMRQPLLSGDVWIAFDHVARVLEALQQKPDEFIVFPAPAGPKGRGYMEVVAGLAAVKRAPDKSGAAELIDYLTQPEAQIVTARSVGFFPVTKVSLPSDIAPGVRMVAAAIQKTQSAKDALPALQPILPGQSAGEFDKVFMDTFQLVALQGQDPRAVLDREAETLNNLMRETGTPCWQPDPPSSGPCRVQ